MKIGVGLGITRGGGGSSTPVDPASIFAVPGTTGLWFLPGTEFGETFQEITGASATTPAGSGDVVGTYHCLITGKYLVAPTDAQRPVLTTDGTLWWAAFDNVDDVLRSPTTEYTMSSSWFMATACQFPSGARTGVLDAAIALAGSAVNYMYVSQRQDNATSYAAIRGSSMSPVVNGTATPSAAGQPQNTPSLNAGKWASGEMRRYRNAALVGTQSATGFTTQTLAGFAALGTTTLASQSRTYSGLWLSRNPSSAEEAFINAFLAERASLTL